MINNNDRIAEALERIADTLEKMSPQPKVINITIEPESSQGKDILEELERVT